MPVHPATLRQWPIADATERYTERDTILYALGLGLGGDPLDPRHLAFTYEKGLKALPGLGFVKGSPGAWFADPATGITFNRLVNAGVSARFHAPFPAAGEVTGRSTVLSLTDRGQGKGAVLVTRRVVHDTSSGQRLCEIDTTYFLMADGGFGGPAPPPAPARSLPDTPPQEVIDWPTLPQAALMYRLNGDTNPLHADPSHAARAGFDRPILHGLCTLGMVMHRVLFAHGDADPSRLRLLEGRFSKPLFPGETLRIEIWKQGDDLALRARSLERDVVVFDQGRATIAPKEGR